MNQQTDKLGVLVKRHLELESGIAEALEELNSEMSTLLNEACIYGPKKSDLDGLAPLVENLQQRYASSKKSRQTLSRRSGINENATTSDESQAVTLKSMLEKIPKRESAPLDVTRNRIRRRLVEAQQTLTANQVALFYSMDFHRRYLLGVLQCDSDDSNYQADGQAFKLPPEKLFGRNC